MRAVLRIWTWLRTLFRHNNATFSRGQTGRSHRLRDRCKYCGERPHGQIELPISLVTKYNGVTTGIAASCSQAPEEFVSRAASPAFIAVRRPLPLDRDGFAVRA